MYKHAGLIMYQTFMQNFLRDSLGFGFFSQFVGSSGEYQETFIFVCMQEGKKNQEVQKREGRYISKD